jgi:hypothetical protein
MIGSIKFVNNWCFYYLILHEREWVFSRIFITYHKNRFTLIKDMLIKPLKIWKISYKNWQRNFFIMFGNRMEVVKACLKLFEGLSNSFLKLYSNRRNAYLGITQKKSI